MRLGHYQQRVLLGLIIITVMGVYVLGFVQSRFMENLNAFAYDLRLQMTAPGPAKNSNVVIVAIDQKSLSAIGRWPWPRNKTADLIRALNHHYHAAVIALDMTFPEKEQNTGLKVLQELSQSKLGSSPTFQKESRRWQRRLNYDQQLATQLAQSPSVLGYYFTTAEKGEKPYHAGVLPTPLFPSGYFYPRRLIFIGGNSYGANLPVFLRSAKSAGCFTAVPDLDGILRRSPMLFEYHGAYYDSLALATADLYLGSPPIIPEFPDKRHSGYQNMDWIRLGDKSIPVGAYATALIPYRGPGRTFPLISAANVMDHRAPMGALFGKVVLVGMTAPGLLDLHATPVGTAYPGVEAQASMVYGILHGTIKEKPVYVTAISISLILVFGLLLAFWLPVLSPLRSLALTMTAIAINIGINLLAWNEGNMAMPVVPVLLVITSLFIINAFYGYFFETKKRRYIMTKFGQYVPPFLVKEMAKFPEVLSMRGQSRDMTVMFSDVVNFTSISEGLSPADLGEMINAYLTAMTQVIQKYQGTVDKYIGDAIMAFWNAPLPDNRHGRKAVLAAMEMQSRLATLGPEFQAKGWPALRAGIGINTGIMSVGNMGSEFRMAYTVMGDVVNTASRLEGLTRKYGVDIIVGEDTRRLVPEVIFREVDRVRVRGRANPLVIYEPIRLRTEMTPEQYKELQQFDLVLDLYRHQRWAEALPLINALTEQSPEVRLYVTYQERVRHFTEQPPPPDWDGVFTFSTK